MHHPCSSLTPGLGPPPPQQVSSNRPPPSPAQPDHKCGPFYPLESFAPPLAAGLTSHPAPHVHRSFLAPASPRAPEWFFYKGVACQAIPCQAGVQNVVPKLLPSWVSAPSPHCLCPHSIVSFGPLTAHLPLPSWALPLLQAGASCQAVPQLQARP